MRRDAASPGSPGADGGHQSRHQPDRGLVTVVRWLLAALLAALAVAALAPAARADGDPGSDVLVYQDMFVAADAGMPVPQQVELGNLLDEAARRGFPVRVAIIAQPADMGAVTALWGKPAAYASFLGIELSLAYKQRLLVVMPNGFGFNWPGHPTTSAYQVLSRIRVGPGGSGLAAATKPAVLALAASSGIKLTAPPGIAATAAPGAAAGSAAGQGPADGKPAVAGPSGIPVLLIVAVVLAAFAAGALAAWLVLRRGLRLASLARPLALIRARARMKLPELPGSRRRILATWLAAALVVAASTGIVVHAVTGPPGGGVGSQQGSLLAANPALDPGMTLSGSAPDFTLTDQFGQPASLRSYRGKVVILTFNDSECTTICPLTTTAMVYAKTMLGEAGSGVQLLGIDANPKATSIEDVRSYSELHGMLYQWRFLTGSLPELQRTWKAYSVGVTISQGQIDHEPAVFVIGPDGKLAKLFLIQQAYSSIGQMGQLLAGEAARMLPGHPPVQSRLSYAQIAGISPATTTALPRAEGGSVSLGPGAPARPRLYLFFATWDQEVTSLAGQLGALNAYQLAAGAAGLPSLTAIDEASVEPSPPALTHFLASLPSPLWYPVAVDRSGQVADGYGVQGQPWFVLASATGQVLWSWQVAVSGWLSHAALDQHVRAALAESKAP